MARVFSAAASVALTVTFALAQTPQKSGATPSVGVFMDFDAAPGDAALQTMETEVSRLLRPAGVSLDWRLAKENRGDESFAGLVVVKFKGSCRVERWSAPPEDFGTLGETRALGSTKVVNGRVLPFSEVECDQVRKALGYLDPAVGSTERQRVLGVALARVLAHELYHVLGRTTGHAARGLAKASQSLQDLVSAPVMEFQQSDFPKIDQP
ncbi:MAG TPA: hypothetical protein VGF16_15280 [Bryobacteraceae bacterium]|jgi:hypothetical protein